MQFRHFDQLRHVADIEPAVLTRRERLERWAELLSREPERRLKTLEEIEFVPRQCAERPRQRAPAHAAIFGITGNIAGCYSDQSGLLVRNIRVVTRRD